MTTNKRSIKTPKALGDEGVDQLMPGLNTGFIFTAFGALVSQRKYVSIEDETRDMEETVAKKVVEKRTRR